MNKLLLIIFSLIICACHPVDKAVKVQSGVEADLTSADGFQLNFGEKIVSGTYISKVTFKNSGQFSIEELSATPLDKDGVLSYTGGAFPGSGGTCGNSVAAGNSCTVEFEFKPSSEGSYNFPITFNYKNGLTSVVKTLNVLGFAGTAAFLKFDDSSDYDFGIHEIGDSFERVYKITNTGGLTAKNISAGVIGDQFSYLGGSYPGSGGTCGISIPAYSSCFIVIRINPTSIANVMNVLSIDYYNGNGVITLSTSLKALIVSLEADLNVIATGIPDFGSATFQKNVSKKFKLMNKGYVDTVSLSFVGSTNFIPGTNTCNGKVEKSKYCEFEILFSPNVAGNLNENFVISYNSGKQIKTTSLTVKGKGITPAILTFDALNINDFGNQAVYAEKTLSFNIKNTGDFTATSVNVTSSSSEFAITVNNCTAIILKNSSCSFSVMYNPQSVGVKTGNITFAYNNGSTTVTADQTLTGNALAMAFLKFSEADPILGLDFGVVPVGATKKFRVKVKNTGLADATRILASFSDNELLHYNGDYDPSSVHNLITDFPDCNLNSGNMDRGFVCYYYDTISASNKLLLNRDVVSTTFISGTIYNSCLSSADLTCNLDWGVNAGIHLYPGTRVLNDLPVCGETLAANQECQIVFESKPTMSNSLNLDLSLDYIADYVAVSQTQTTKINISGLNVASPVFTVEGKIISDLAAGFTYASAYNLDEKIYTTLTVTNSGQLPLTFNTINWSDASQTNFSFTKDSRTSTAPGQDPLGAPGSCNEGGTLSANASCAINIWFVPSQVGSPLVDNLVVNFNDGNDTQNISMAFKGIAGNLAQFQTTPITSTIVTGYKGVILKPVANQSPLTNNILRTITIKNVGSSSLQFNSIALCGSLLNYSYDDCSSIYFADGNFDPTTTNSCTNATVGIGGTCTLDIQFSPQAVVANNYFTFMVEYVSNGITVKKHLFGQLDSAPPAELKFDESGALGTTPYDYQLQEYLETATADVTLTNLSGNLDASNLSFAITNDSDGAFSVDASNTNCGSSLSFGTYCTVRVNFIPNRIGNFTGKVVANYFDGKSNVSTSLDLIGQGEPPRSNHKGWSKVIAIGDKVNISSVSDAGKYIEIAWNNMQAKTGYTITGYNIYRKLGDGYYGNGVTQDDFTVPLNSSPISTSVNKYTDTNITSGQVYVYQVRPIIMGYPSRTMEAIKDVAVTAPPENMVLVHRWMANQIICTKLAATSDLANNYRCPFSGAGSKSGYFDLGSDLLVDRFEMGTDKTSRYGQTPIKDTQVNINSNCDSQGDFLITNINKTSGSRSYRKRLPSRKEFNIAALWPSTDTDTAISTKEKSATSTTSCNGANGASVEKSGNNSACKSYFGIEDAAGNEFEWVSDRIVNGVGVTDQMNTDIGYELRLDPNNKDLSGIDFSTLIPSGGTSMLMKDAPCFTVGLGIVLPLNANTGTCLNAKSVSSLGASYFHSNTYSVQSYTDLKGLASGGAAYIDGSSGAYSSYWLGVNTTIGGRCVIKLDY